MNSQSAAGGLSFGSVLFFIFLVMKLTHYINWSWWWVTCPLWLPLAIFGVIAIGCGLFLLLATAVIALADRDK